MVPVSCRSPGPLLRRCRLTLDSEMTAQQDTARSILSDCVRPSPSSVFSLLHHLHHHRPGSGQDQVADGPVVQVEDVEAVD